MLINYGPTYIFLTSVAACGWGCLDYEGLWLHTFLELKYILLLHEWIHVACFALFLQLYFFEREYRQTKLCTCSWKTRDRRCSEEATWRKSSWEERRPRPGGWLYCAPLTIQYVYSYIHVLGTTNLFSHYKSILDWKTFAEYYLAVCTVWVQNVSKVCISAFTFTTPQ